MPASGWSGSGHQGEAPGLIPGKTQVAGARPRPICGQCRPEAGCHRRTRGDAEEAALREGGAVARSDWVTAPIYGMMWLKPHAALGSQPDCGKWRRDDGYERRCKASGLAGL